jgi:hypothetical protein
LIYNSKDIIDNVDINNKIIINKPLNPLATANLKGCENVDYIHKLNVLNHKTPLTSVTMNKYSSVSDTNYETDLRSTAKPYACGVSDSVNTLQKANVYLNYNRGGNYDTLDKNYQLRKKIVSSGSFCR